MIQGLGRRPQKGSDQDLNEDGVVDLIDVLLLIGTWSE